MAVKTGEIFNSLVFGGVNSADYGIYITGEGVFNAPKRAVNMVAVPGRNGSIAIDQGHWENIEVTYPAGTFGMDEEEFRTALSNFRNAIASQVGYQRLTDTYHPDEYRMAIYMDGLEVEPTTYNKAGEFELKFNCKPQRWLTSGEVPVTIGEWGATKDASGEIVTIESEGGEIAKSLVVELEPIQDLNGYDAPWVGGAGKNKLPSHAVGTVTSNGLTTTYYADGSLKINGTATASTDVGVWNSGNVAEGIQGSYKLNGCTNGASSRYQLIARVRNTSASTNRYVQAPNGDVAISTSDTEVINSIYINVKPDVPMNNVMFYPMLRLSTVSDATFEPYENICPISGRTSVETTRTGKNLLPQNRTSGTVNGVTAVRNDDGSWTLSGTCTANADLELFASSTFDLVSGVAYTLTGCPSGGGDSTYRLRVRVNTNGTNSYPGDVGNGVTFTVGDNAVVNNCYIELKNGYTYNGVTFKPMLRLATDTDGTYEPYNGQTYTTSLGRTVYGGTLDVVSGVLTVDRAMVDLGSLTYTYQHSTTRNDFYVTISDAIEPIAGGDTKAVCSCYERMPFSSMQNGGFCISDYDRNPVDKLLLFRNKQYTSADDFKASMSGQTLVYALETPQTYQLTPQQISLLVGENHVWSDGSITMQYGDDPNSLRNPTRYDAGPLLITDGYGTISFNGYDIEITHVPVGWVTLANRGEKYLTTALPNASGRYSVKWNSELLQTGDTINVASRSDRAHKITFNISNLISLDTYTYSNSNPNAIDESVLEFAFDNVSFTAGTARTITNTLTVTPTGSGSSASWTGSIRYDGDSTITFSISKSSTDTFRFEGEGYVEWSNIESKSTAQAFGRPTYIDCELGEAYKIENDEIISLNKYLDLGSDLPKLSSGANDVTTDSTITELKVVPNWWKL